MKRRVIWPGADFVVYFFVIQAKDGIRDFHVTGVQTCALPIYIIAKEIAQKIIEVLKKHDLEVSWNGKANSPIHLSNFKWERVYSEEDRDLLNYNFVIDSILLNK